MEILTQTEKNEISRVLEIKKKHSEIQEDEAETCFDCFNIVWKKKGETIDSYINHLYPVFYYEWSREQTDTGRPIPMYLSLAVRHYLTFTCINFDIIDHTNNTTFKQRFKQLDETFKKYHFDNLEMFFVIGGYIECGEWEKTDIDKFLENRSEIFRVDEISLPELYKKYENLNCKLQSLLQDHEALAIENRRLRFKLEDAIQIKNQYREQFERMSSDLISKKNGILTFKNEECVICYQNKPNILFCNCGHLCICDECDKLSSSSKCPVCRDVNSIKRKIF